MEQSEEQKDFADPPEDIVAYAKKHNIDFNLRSTIVQRVLRLRIEMGLPAKDKQEKDDIPPPQPPLPDAEQGK